MKTKFFGFLLLILTQHAIGQKKPLDYDAIDSWPNIENEKISNDGKYICYNISSKKDGTKLFLQSTDNLWKMEIKDGTNAVITDDSRLAIFKTNGDSIVIAELGNGKTNYLKNASTFKVPQDGDGRWVAYQEKDPAKTLILIDLYSGNQVKKYDNVNEFEFSDNGRKLLVQQVFKNSSEEVDSVHFLDLGKSISDFVWGGGKSFSFIIDTSGSQMAFINETIVNNEKTYRIWYHKTGMDSAIVLIDKFTPGMQGANVLVNSNFSQDGENLFFSTLDSSGQEKEDSLKKLPHDILLWSYRDWELGDRSGSINTEHAAVINLQTKNQVVRIEKDEGDRSEGSLNWCYSKNSVLLTTNNLGDVLEHEWRSSARPSLYLVSTVDGKRILLSQDCLLSYGNYGFSPMGNYVFWFDVVKGHWFTYNINSGIVRNISALLPVSTAGNDGEYADYSYPEGFAGWIKSEAGLLVYDKYDIWQLDPSGQRAPKNITDGFGRKHKTIFRNLDQSAFANIGHPIFESGDSLLLYSINSISKANGFAKIFLHAIKPPKVLMEGQMDYYGLRAGAFETESSDGFVLKAKHANTYIFRPNRDSLYADLNVTADLVHFRNLTNLAPQKRFIWFRSQLVHWKQEDGQENDGILYKPEDFDPKKKYPLIVYVYEQFSESVNRFFTPELSSGDIIIPWYTSHGYLMFVPDIHYVLGHPGRSAYNSVISGIKHLSDSAWVDTKRLGLQGHSFGGYETNYIVTRTNIFAAASSADGVSDWITCYGQLMGKFATQSFVEKSQGRMGATLWQRPDQYIGESPIFKVDQIKTPLFILHNTQDDIVNVSQSIELFTSLRRLRKIAWMLQYTNVGHNIRDEKAQLDYSIRLNQFFDHYLKDAPAPQWMTQGGTSLELDLSGRKP